ncbi:hypothetical protein OC834_003888 [Tilletia horrida]|nr:hypothetical protein OC834_003888 [Tilletia horrida]
MEKDSESGSWTPDTILNQAGSSNPKAVRERQDGTSDSDHNRVQVINIDLLEDSKAILTNAMLVQPSRPFVVQQTKVQPLTDQQIKTIISPRVKVDCTYITKTTEGSGQLAWTRIVDALLGNSKDLASVDVRDFPSDNDLMKVSPTSCELFEMVTSLQCGAADRLGVDYGTWTHPDQFAVARDAKLKLYASVDSPTWVLRVN